jgi:hypothetical protein
MDTRQVLLEQHLKSLAIGSALQNVTYEIRCERIAALFLVLVLPSSVLSASVHDAG